MEGDELEMNRDELQKWIREKVENRELITPGLLEKCDMLQSLLERREKCAANLLKLWESVAACEATLKKQYSLLGWEYRDTDSEDDVDTGCEHVPHSSHDPVQSETGGSLSPATRGHTLNGNNDKKTFPCIRNPVVSLTRLPEWKLTSLLASTSQEDDSENEFNSDSGDQWEPERNSSDSDWSVSFNSSNKKRRKKNQKSNEKLGKKTQPVASKADDDDSVAETKAPQASNQTIAKYGDLRTVSPPAKTEVTAVPSACSVSASCQSTGKATDETTKNLPVVPEKELSVDMTVVARRRQMNWQQGKIKEILRKDGRLKYKVVFEEMGKIRVSGYHIALDHVPKIEQLFVGARVVVKCDAVRPYFCPAFIAELPCRKNTHRFLVFFDDHTALYVGLSLLLKVYQPLTEPLDDIVDEVHRAFMKDYLESWPQPHMVHYREGLVIKAEFNGVQQECEVRQLDCSLIEVVFKADQHTEWIYRGSVRLEQVLHMRAQMKSRQGKKAH